VAERVVRRRNKVKMQMKRRIRPPHAQNVIYLYGLLLKSDYNNNIIEWLVNWQGLFSVKIKLFFEIGYAW
jgi:hypothetical protein